MGCPQSRPSSSAEHASDEEQPAPKQYSWDKREKVDPKDFTIENVKGETVGRLPGTINGQQFIIQNCEDTNIYLFDHVSSVTVDDCTNCRIFIGPIKTSVFIRDSKQCKVMLSCQQFRTRDCQKIDAFVCCVSQPIIEASTGMKFGCFQYHYPELEGQYQSSGLSIYNNKWSDIHDFTPVPGENNYSHLPEDVNIEDYIPLPNTPTFENMQICTTVDKSVVPRTVGLRRKTSDQSCLVVFFSDGLSHERASSFLAEMRLNHTNCALIKSRELRMQTGQATSVFGSENYASVIDQGPLIGFEFSGEDVCKACQATLVSVSRGSTGLVFVSSSAASAAQQVEDFFNYADMQMNA